MIGEQLLCPRAIMDRAHFGKRIARTRGIGARRCLLRRVPLRELQRRAVQYDAIEFEPAADPPEQFNCAI